MKPVAVLYKEKGCDRYFYLYFGDEEITGAIMLAKALSVDVDNYFTELIDTIESSGKVPPTGNVHVVHYANEILVFSDDGFKAELAKKGLVWEDPLPNGIPEAVFPKS